MEVSVRLLEEQEDNGTSSPTSDHQQQASSSSSSNNPQKKRVILDEQLVLLRGETVFEFLPIHSKAENLLIEVRSAACLAGHRAGVQQGCAGGGGLNFV